MTPQWSKMSASAPGSIMITGEHAVVYGYPAVVCAIDQRVTITATPQATRQLQIFSGISDPVAVALDGFDVSGPMRFVLAAVALYRGRLSHGLRLDIVSQIDPTLGLGSSAAVTIATLGLLEALTQTQTQTRQQTQTHSGTAPKTETPTRCAPLSARHKVQLHHQALRIIRNLQGRGSGADLAASLHGGLLGYQLGLAAANKAIVNGPPKDAGMFLQSSEKGDHVSNAEHATILSLPRPPQMSLCYCGYKTPTGQVLAALAQKMVGREVEFAALYARMGACAMAAISSAQRDDWRLFGEQLNAYQGLMVELGVSDPTLDALVARARDQTGVTAAKISGSGLGDCILALGPLVAQHQPAPFTAKGLLLDD